MLGRVKRYFGIEGVKVELDIPEELPKRTEQLTGKLQFSSMNTQSVTAMRIKIVERYTRGRGENKKIDEYELGLIELEKEIEVVPEKITEIEFVLPFKLVHSEVDDFAGRNLLFKGIANVAKKAYAAQSEYVVIAEAKVKGTALHPFCKKNIKIL